MVDDVVSPKKEQNKAVEGVPGMADEAVKKEKVAAEDAETKKLEEPNKEDEEKIAGTFDRPVENGKAEAEDAESKKLEELEKIDQENTAGITNRAIENERAEAKDEKKKKLEEAEKKDEENTGGITNRAFENEKPAAEDAGIKKLEDPKKREESKEREEEKMGVATNRAVENEKAGLENAEKKEKEEPKKGDDTKNVEVENQASSPGVAKTSNFRLKSTTFRELMSSSFREESTLLCDLRELEKKALTELKEKLEEAILVNTLFSNEEQKIEEKAAGDNSVKKGKSGEGEGDKSVAEGKKEEEKTKPAEDEGKTESKEEEKPAEQAKVAEEVDEKERQEAEVDKDISLWGVPLLPSKDEDSTNVLLLKFLRAREFRVNDAFLMLKNTLQWRKEFKTDMILDEEFDSELNSTSYLKGLDRDGHPICYNIYGLFEKEELYQKTFGTEEKHEKFLRWRVREMEKSIRELDFKPGGICTILQINDLNNTPGPSKRDLRLATRQAVTVLQDNYPEFIAKNVRISAQNWLFLSIF